MTCGIYAIVNRRACKVYVGSSQNIERRWNTHRHLLRRGTHYSPHLQRAWAKDGESAFVFAVLERLAVDQLIAREQEWLDETGCCNSKLGYNIAKCAEAPTRGRKFSAEWRAKLSAAMRGKKNSLGTKYSLEVRTKVSRALRGNTNSLGVRHTAAARANMSAAQRARAPATPQARARMQAAQATRRRVERSQRAGAVA